MWFTGLRRLIPFTITVQTINNNTVAAYLKTPRSKAVPLHQLDLLQNEWIESPIPRPIVLIHYMADIFFLLLSFALCFPVHYLSRTFAVKSFARYGLYTLSYKRPGFEGCLHLMPTTLEFGEILYIYIYLYQWGLGKQAPKSELCRNVITGN